MAQNYCGICGNAVKPDDLFCTKCGAHLGSENIGTKQPGPAAPVQKQSSQYPPPLPPVQQQTTPDANVNPFTADVAIQSETLVFKCPTCPNTIRAPMQNIDPIVGLSVLCSSCKNVSHVPGIYKTELKPTDTRITGSVRVPIANLWDWYYEHPYIVSLIKSGQASLLYDYGFWAYCGACYHEFHATVLISFIITMRRPTTFFAKTPDSARDYNALRDGHCAHCQHKDILVIVSEIPDYVRNVIASRTKGSEAKLGETKTDKFPRDSAALEFSMEPRKTMDELTAAGRAELRTCSSCHMQTPVPIDTPPCAIPLICQHCGAPLMSISPELDYVRPELVSQVFGYRNRGLLHVFCPWCKEKNYAITAPANCVSTNYYVISEPQNPQALFRMQVDCVHCQKEFWLEWDE